MSPHSSKPDQPGPDRPGRATVPPAPRVDGSSLEAVGINPSEERLYEVLLEHPGAPVSAIATATGLSRSTVSAVLRSLEHKGIVTHTPDRQPRYFPTPPDVALEMLIAERQEALQRVRLAVSRFQEKARRGRDGRHADERATLIQIVRGREAQAAVFNHIQRAAREEVIGFDRPPYVIATSAVNKSEFETMRRGVRYRGVYGGGALELPDAAERIRACMEAGEEARVFRDVPLKLIAADRRVAMVPLDLARLEDAALLVRSSSLLDALYELFEAIWSRATPITLTRSGELDTAGNSALVSERLERLVPMLAAGLNDKTIAYQLGISQRTLDRYMREFMRGLDARTRFQAGWLAALRYSPGASASS